MIIATELLTIKILLLMEYFLKLFKDSCKAMVVMTLLAVVLWSALYHLTNFAMVATYFGIGVGVCLLNCVIAFIRQRDTENKPVISVNWIIMAGVVLVLYHLGFVPAAVFAAAVIFVSPFFGKSLYEGIVGLSLLLTLAWQMR